MKYQVIKNYCFLGQWFHHVRKLNERGEIVAQMLTGSEKVLEKYQRLARATVSNAGG